MLGLEAVPLGPSVAQWLRVRSLECTWVGVRGPPRWVSVPLLTYAGGPVACGLCAGAWDEDLPVPEPHAGATGHTAWLVDLIGAPSGAGRRWRARLGRPAVTPWSRLAALLGGGWVDPVQFRPIDQTRTLVTVVRRGFTRI